MKWTWFLILMLMMLFPAASAVSYPQLRGYVTDNAKMIDQSYEAKITQLAGEIERESTVQIAVVTVDSLEGEEIGMYAANLFEKAGIGEKDKNNGLLIIVAKDSHDYDFEYGYGLEGTLTDSMKVNIGKRIIEPNFKNGDYGKGIYESMLVVQELVRGNPEVASQYNMYQGDGNSDIQFSGDVPAFAGLFMILFVLVVIFIIFIAIMNASYDSNTSWKRRRTYGNTPVMLPDFGWRMGGGGFGGGGFGGGFGGGHSGGGFGGGFGGFGGGRSGGGGFRGKW